MKSSFYIHFISITPYSVNRLLAEEIFTLKSYLEDQLSVFPMFPNIKKLCHGKQAVNKFRMITHSEYFVDCFGF